EAGCVIRWPRASMTVAPAVAGEQRSSSAHRTWKRRSISLCASPFGNVSFNHSRSRRARASSSLLDFTPLVPFAIAAPRRIRRSAYSRSDILAHQVEADDGAEPNSGLESCVSDHSFETIFCVQRVRNHLNDPPPCGRGCASNMVARMVKATADHGYGVSDGLCNATRPHPAG